MPLHLDDVETVTDLRVFLERAERLGSSSTRLQTFGTVLAVTIPVLSPRGLGDPTPLIIAMRTSAIQPTEPVDTVVAIRSILERIARFAPGAGGSLEWPPTTLTEAWAGIAPPIGEWEVLSDVTIPSLQLAAERTLAQLASVTTTQPEQVLAAALSAHDAELGVPAGLPAVAQSLGFLIGEAPARLSRNGRWSRLTTNHGHVLSRA